MENCFRFLINVDQCLNMSYFDMFFYKLESQHQFHMNSVQLFGESADSSLRNAISDIRMYLNKYPYHVGNYQIIVAMRSTFRSEVLRWEETMLYRLLRLDHELRRAHILINSREKTEKALNLIMLYDTDFSVELEELAPYKDSARLHNDCMLLLQHLSVPGTATQEELEQALAAYRKRQDRDSSAEELLQAFLERRRRSQAHNPSMEEHMDPVSIYADADSPLAAELTDYIQDQLYNFQIFEEYVDRNSRRQQTLALLRVTEYINMDIERPVPVGGHHAVTSLSQICADNWKKVWQDPTLEQRYADMLQDYRYRLSTAAIELESTKVSSASGRQLPNDPIPDDNAISCKDSPFSKEDPKKQDIGLKSLFGQFLERGFSLSQLQHKWPEVYQQSKQILEKMEFSLKNYAEELSRQYAAVLEERKQDHLVLRSGFYIAGPDTENEISRLAHERDQRLQQLKSPHMTPSLTFQDQLNMENALEQANQTIRFNLRCMQAVNMGSFLVLAGLCLAAVFAHYTFLQPYVFREVSTLVCYLTYFAAAAVLMLFCWSLPYGYFRSNLKRCIRTLLTCSDLYISGYYAKAEHFYTYINLLNQLDHITRYHRLLTQAHSATHKLSQGYLWHKVQVQQHLHKLQFFQGLIEHGQTSIDTLTEPIVPGIEGDRVCDYIDSQLYWPQG